MKKMLLIVLVLALSLTCFVGCGGIESEIERAEAAIDAFIEESDFDEDSLDAYDAEDEDAQEMAEWLTESTEIEVELAAMYTFGMDDLFIFVCTEGDMAEDVVTEAKKHGAKGWEYDGNILVYGDADDVNDFMEILTEEN